MKTLKSELLTLDVTVNDTVGNVKGQIQYVEKIPPDQQRLICAGRQLEDDKTLGFYKIQKGGNLDSVPGLIYFSLRVSGCRYFILVFILCQVLRLRGSGEGRKRGRAEVASIPTLMIRPTMTDSDMDEVKNTLSLDSFNVDEWLSVLPSAKLQELSNKPNYRH